MDRPDSALIVDIPVVTMKPEDKPEPSSLLDPSEGRFTSIELIIRRIPPEDSVKIRVS